MAPRRLAPRGRAAAPPGAGEESIPAPAPRAKAKPRTRRAASTRKHIRNIRGVLVRVTLDNGRRILLEPRGQRGDQTAITEDDQDDAIFLNNLGLLYEVLSHDQANEARDKQSKNQNPSAHPSTQLLDHLGNPIPFNGSASSVESQGVVVATLDEISGDPYSEREIEVNRVRGPERVNVPGSLG